MAAKTRAELELENDRYRAKLEGLYDNLGSFLGIDEDDDPEDPTEDEQDDEDDEEDEDV